MKSNIIFVIFVLAVLGFLYSISGKKNPQIPADPAHKDITEISVCISCHSRGAKSPMKSTHPPKFECFKCHKHKKVKPA